MKGRNKACAKLRALSSLILRGPEDSRLKGQNGESKHRFGMMLSSRIIKTAKLGTSSGHRHRSQLEYSLRVTDGEHRQSAKRRSEISLRRFDLRLNRLPGLELPTDDKAKREDHPSDDAWSPGTIALARVRNFGNKVVKVLAGAFAPGVHDSILGEL